MGAAFYAAMCVCVCVCVCVYFVGVECRYDYYFEKFLNLALKLRKNEI